MILINRFLAIIIALSFVVATGQTTGKEQIALDYFATEVFVKEFDCKEKVYFSGTSEEKTKLDGRFSKCFELGEEFENFCYNYDSEVLGTVPLTLSDKINSLNKPKKRKLQLSVYRHLKFESDGFVLISVYKEDFFIDYYLIKIEDDKAVAHCHIGEII